MALTISPVNAAPAAIYLPGLTTLTFVLSTDLPAENAMIRYQLSDADPVVFVTASGQPWKVAWKMPLQVTRATAQKVSKVLTLEAADGAPRNSVVITILVQSLDDDGNPTAEVSRKKTLKILE